MVEKEPERCRLDRGNGTLTFAMTGCNAPSIELINPTVEQAIVNSLRC